MGSVIQFFKTYLHVILLIALLSTGIFLLVSYHAFYKTHFSSISINLSGKVQSYLNYLFHYSNLNKTNQDIINENVYLRGYLKENYHIQPKDSFSVNDTVYRQRYVYLPATVIGNTVDRANNYLTINRGANSGLSVGMGVFSPEGVVGVIEEVSENFALVMSILHSKMIISPKVQELNLSQGKVKWEERNPDFVFLSGINRYEKIEKGHLIVTSPYSKNFPENIPIGTVEEVKEIDGSFLRAKINLATNFAQVREVYVVKDLFKEELEKFNTVLEAENK